MKTLLFVVLVAGTSVLAADPPQPKRGMDESTCLAICRALERLLKAQKTVCPDACQGKGKYDKAVSGCTTAGDDWDRWCSQGKEACGSEPPVCVIWPTKPKNC